MFSKQRIKLFFIGLWGPTLGLFIGFIVIGGIYTYRLKSLVPSYSPAEQGQLSQTLHFRGIVKNPVNAPFKLPEYALRRFLVNNIFTARSISVIYALLAVALFYYILVQWYSQRVAILGTVLFASSTWLLHYARLAIPDVELTLFLAAWAYGAWLRKTNRSAIAVLLGVALAVSLVYVAGLLWFVLIGGIWQYRNIKTHVKNAKLSTGLITIVGLVLLAPLVISIARQPSLLKPLVGIPQSLPNAYDYVRHTLNVPYQIVWKGPNDPTIWLGRLPLLDLFTSAMALIGLFAYFNKLSLDRSRALLGMLVIGTLLVGLRGSISIILLLPAVYFMVTAGIDYLLKQWRTVYPRNPLARSLSYGLIIIAVFLSSYYNLRRYFVAWPAAPATKQAYHLRS